MKRSIFSLIAASSLVLAACAPTDNASEVPAVEEQVQEPMPAPAADPMDMPADEMTDAPVEAPADSAAAVQG